MGSYVLYLLMQAFVALVFAYFSATMVFKERKLSMILVSIGFYLLLGSALVEVWRDRAGWTATTVGLNAALVATGVAAMGTGALLREARDMENGEQVEALAKVFLGIAGVMGVVLAIAGGSSGSIVDGEAIIGAEISGAFSHLGPAGWALGSSLFIGGLLLGWMGARGTMVRRDINGAWLMGAGVLYLLWPFDLWLNNLPLNPAIILMAITMTYFGFQLPKKDEEDEKEDEAQTDGPGKESPGDEHVPAAWVKEAIAAQEAKRSTGADEDLENEGPKDERVPHEEKGSEEVEEGPSQDADEPTS